VPAAAEPQATAGDKPPISFGPFRILPTQRLLLEGDQPVRLGSRAFEILAALVERSGEVVGKDDLAAEEAVVGLEGHVAPAPAQGDGGPAGVLNVLAPCQGISQG
jgi:hypothetical protein